MRQMYSESIVPRGLRLVDLADMLAPFCGNQTINGVVAIVIARRHDLIIEIDRLLGVVHYPRDVTAGIVGITQVLQMFGAAQRLQASEAESQRIILVVSPGVIPVFDERSLALGVV